MPGRAALLTFFAAVLAPALSFAQSASIPAYGDALVTASIGEPTSFVPILASDTSSAEVCGLVFNGLVKYGRDLQLTGDLAERWEIAQGGLEIRFFLKKGVRWHDGAPFTAHDVAFTFEQLTNPKVPTPYSGDFERVQSLEVLDDYSLRVLYKEPFAPGLSSWGMWIMPKHLLENQDLTTTRYREAPIGTGPFKFYRWLRGDRVELKANGDYFEGRPYLDWYIIRTIPDPSTIFLELQSGSVDNSSLTPLQFERLAKSPRFEQAFHKFRYPSFGYSYVGFNLKDKRFADRNIRKALSMAIDRQEILQGVLLGLGRQATGPYPPESWAYNPQVQTQPYDPEGARKLLKEAGWEDRDGDGILDKEGQPFEFTLLTNQGNLPRELSAQIIQRRLKEVGIKVNLWILEWSSLLHQFIDKRKFEAVLLGWSLSRDPDLYDLWHSSKTKEGEFNFLSYSNAQVDCLLEEGRKEFDIKKRTRIYQALHQLLDEDQAACFLYVADALPVIHKRFREVEVSPIGIGYNLIDWHVPQEEQKYRLEP